MEVFKYNLDEVRNLDGLFAYLSKQVTDPMLYDDLLRSQIVYSVSAFDKLIHDLVRIGMVQMFSGMRDPTKKFLAEPITIELYNKLVAETNLPRENMFDLVAISSKEDIFEREMFKKFKSITYQDPDKVVDGLSYVWNEQHKWQKIALCMGKDKKYVREELKLIVDRRNSIVHEADIDPIKPNP